MCTTPHPRRVWLAALVLLVPLTPSPGPHAVSAAPPPPSTSPYVDARVCAECHAEIDRAYRQTGMGRSFSRPGPETLPAGTVANSRFHHRPSDTHYAIVARGGAYYQRRWQTGASGNELYLREWKIDYVMGSGNHSRSYLHRGAGGRLTELPLAWYSENGGLWAMNPGYDSNRVIMPRRIVYECMFCHNGYPRIPAGYDRWGSDPAYQEPLPEGIDCQRCHGPGAAHVRAAKGGAGDLRGSIVNPARLGPDQQMEVCMQCHLQTTSFRLPGSIRRFDRAPFSYRPGQPLSDFVIHFDRAARTVPEDRFEIASSAYRLRQSKCFVASKGTLTCLTCHDPHRDRGGTDTAGRYGNACRKCHAAAFQTMIVAGKHPGDPDCVACHMPKRRTEDAVHVVVTDHLIQRRKPARDLLADVAERQETDQDSYHGEVVPYYPAPLPSRADNGLYVAVAQVQHNSNLETGLPRLSAELDRRKPSEAGFYFELGEAWRNRGLLEKAAAAYQEAARRNAGSALVSRRLGDVLRRSGHRAEAAAILKRAVAAAPDNATGWYELGVVHADLGNKPDAVAAFQKAAALDPDLPEAHNSLGVTLVESGQPVRAETAFREALRAKPDYADAHANLGLLLASKGSLDEAVGHFETGLRHAPDNAEARCNYAVVLSRLDRLETAQRQLEAAIRTNPDFPRAHELLGTVLASQDRVEEAIREFQEWLRLQPASPQAHLNLGMLLIQKRDIGAAAGHLRLAARGPDPAVSQRARELLRRIGSPPQ